MKPLRSILLFALMVLFSCQQSQQTNESQGAEAKINKAWQLNTSGLPAPYAPNVISTGREFAISFTPDGKEAYFTRTGEAGNLTIYQADFDGIQWSTPRPASFSGTFQDADPFVTYDGRQLFFMSFRPTEAGEAPMESPDIWYVNRTENGWSDPIHLETVNTPDYGEGFPSVALNGNLYFPSDREGGNDIYVSHYKNGKYQSPVKLDTMINSAASDSNPGIAPDESLLFFYSSREGIQGAVDLFVSRKENGQWSPAKRLGPEVNSSHADYCPYVSPDMNYLFYSTGERSDTGNTNHIYSIALDRALKGLSD